MNLRTERLNLQFLRRHLLTSGDMSDLLSLLSSEENLKQYGIEPIKDQAGLDIYLDNQQVSWLIRLDNKIIGIVGLHQLDSRNQNCRIAYILGEEWQGKGYATEAVRAVIDFGFTPSFFTSFNTLATRIEATTYTDNHSSINLLLRLGFKEDCTLRHYYRCNKDGKLFSLLKEDRYNEKE